MRKRIEGDGLVARAFREDDALALHAAVRESIDEISRYETWCHSGYSLQDAKEYVGWWIQAREAGTAFYYVIEDPANGMLLGACGLSDYCAEHRRAMLGYWIRAPQTRRGLATEAAWRICDAGFTDLDLIRIGIGAPAGNVPSRRVAEKLGALQEGVLRCWLILLEGPSDVITYGLLRSEWGSPPPRDPRR